MWAQAERAEEARLVEAERSRVAAAEAVAVAAAAAAAAAEVAAADAAAKAAAAAAAVAAAKAEVVAAAAAAAVEMELGGDSAQGSCEEDSGVESRLPANQAGLSKVQQQVRRTSTLVAPAAARGTNEMLQPCPVFLRVISLVPIAAC